MCLGIPGVVESINGPEAIVDFGGAKRKVRLDLLEGVNVGDYVLVHAGFAIQKLTSEDASEMVKAIIQLGELMGWS